MNHSHILYDSDPHFKIDPISRKITNESSTKTTIIQHDHNSERFTFEVPRYVEGHDLSLCNIVEVHYLNIEANSKTVRNGVYTVDDLHVKEGDENTVVCSWLITDNATQFVGQLQFLIRFSCAQADTGTVDYVWNTGIYNAISVSLGIYNSETPSDTRQPAFNFVTTIDGQTLKFFVGTQAKYNALSHEDKQGLFAIITDDKTKEKIENALREITQTLESGRIVIKEVMSLEELESLITNNPQGSFFVTTSKNIVIPMVSGLSFQLPRWCYGSLVVANGDAGLNLVGVDGVHITAYYNNNPDMRGWTIRKLPKEAETARKLSEDWTYEGEWNGLGGKTLGWNDYRGMYAIKLVDIGAVNKGTYTFVITPDSADQYGDTYSNCVYYHGNGPAGLLWLRTRCTDIINLYVGNWDFQDDFSTTSTYKVYWKKIF